MEVSNEAEAVPVDRLRLRLMLAQLLDNAYRFGTPGAEVYVRGELTGDPPRLVVRVTNQGEPVPDALRSAIFEPFRQAEHPYTRRHGGLGLGLTVARRAAEGAGGTLVLEPGEPTTFRLELPAREDPLRTEVRTLRARADLADAQALRAIQDLRSLRASSRREPGPPEPGS